MNTTDYVSSLFKKSFLKRKRERQAEIGDPFFLKICEFGRFLKGFVLVPFSSSKQSSDRFSSSSSSSVSNAASGKLLARIGWFKKIPTLWFASLLVFGLLLFLLWTFFSRMQKGNHGAFAAVEKKSLSSSISVTGEVSSEYRRVLSFPNNGEIKRIAVKEGDYVKKGDFLAELDSTKMKADLDSLNAEAQVLEASLAKLSHNLDIVVKEKALSRAKIDLQKAKLALEKAEKANDLTIEQRRLQLAQAQQALENYERDSAQALTVSALVKNDAAEDYDDVKTAKSRGQASLEQRENAERSYEIAIEQYVGEQFKRETGLDEREGVVRKDHLTLEEAVLNFRLELENAKNNVKQASAFIEQQEVEVQQIKKDRPQDKKATQAKLSQVKASKVKAEEALADSKLYAPSNGTVISIAQKEGELFSGNTLGKGFIEIADLKRLQVEVDVSEADIVSVKSGQKVILDFDALPDETFPGKVQKVYPGPHVVQGVVNYKVVISFEQDPRIRLGMSANVEIITAESQGAVITVPLRSVSVDREGVSYVWVEGSDGELVKRKVVLGISNGTDVEVINGIKEGDHISAVPPGDKK